MRLHRNLVFTVLDSLHLIFNEGQYADKVIEKALKKDKRWGARDRAFIASTTYEIIRYKRLYAEIAEVNGHFSVQNIKRMFAVWTTLKGIQIPADWPEFEPTPTRKIKGRFDALIKTRAIRESIPDWLDTLGEQSLGDQLWEAEIKALNEEADVVLRINTLKTTIDLAEKRLQEEGIDTVRIPDLPEALRLVERQNVFLTQSFKDGWFEIQDGSSQKVAPLLDIRPGQRVIDACAGAGGKTLHLSSLLENKGQLIAMDIHQYKLNNLKLRARRAGAHNIETRLIDSNKVIKKLYGSADRVLIDAPCTGLGVLRRNPDAKWKIDSDFLDRVVATQQEILQSYSKLVKVGGKIIYATCSILPQENDQQIEKFMTSEAGKNFSLIESHNLYASKDHFDGFFIALLERKT